MVKRVKLSLAQHYALGQQLCRQQSELVTATTKISNAYGAVNPARRSVWSVDRALQKLRSDLDDQLVRDHGDAWCAHVYYPGNDEEHARHLETCSSCQDARQAAVKEELI